jgi:hypothetical protein
MEQVNTRVCATYNPDGGSTFAFRLPLDGVRAPALSATGA